MSSPYGHTRTRLAHRHALITPDGHVKSNVPGIASAATIIVINPAIGANFSQLLVTFESGGGVVTIGREKARVVAGGYFFAPSGEAWSITAPKRKTRVTLFQKKFKPLAGAVAPR